MSRWDDDFDFDEFDGDGDEGFDGEPSDYHPNEISAEEAYLIELAENLGLEDISQIIVNSGDVQHPEDIRGDRFTSLTDAIDYLMSLGLIGFSEIVYFEDDDLWGAAVPDDSANPNS